MIAVTFCVGYGIVPAILLKLWPAPEEPGFITMQEALITGVLSSADVDVLEAAEINEIEDEGLHFLLAAASGETLILSGQYLYGPVERREFPADRVRVYRNAATGEIYGVATLGRPFETGTWPIYDCAQTNDETLSAIQEDGKFHSQTISDLIATLGVVPGRRRERST